MGALKSFLCILVLSLASTLPVSARETPAVPEGFLSTLHREHPRLMLTDGRLGRLEAMRADDPALEKCIDDVVTQADRDITLPPLEHKLIGPRLLSVSRECLRRVFNLALAFRFTGEERYAAAARDNMLTVCAFPDWNPSHFLDTAEMSNAVGVGYDWLHNWLDDATRATIREGLIRNGLAVAVKAYRGEDGVPNWWAASYHNWNQVCNGGLIVGALAIAETDPEYAETIIPAAVKSLPLALGTYAPDGAWPEGPGYWHYATRYTAYGLSALSTALGTDYGLSDLEGMDVTAVFPIYTTGPTGLYINFADSGERARRRAMPCVFWLANRYDIPFAADAEHEMIARHGAQAQHIVWYAPPAKGSYSPDLDRLFKGSVEVAAFRSAWDDPDALFVGFKAGYNQVNHGHLDLGNFELDALGVRWARDLGSDNYNLPDYWGRDRDATRWTYYRLGSYSHNVCTINGAQQDVMAESSFSAFHSGQNDAFGIVDVTSAYAPASSKSTRGIRLVDNRRAVLVVDEFALDGAADIAWGMTTDAAIEPDGRTATLTQDGKALVARILSPEGAVFTVESAERKPPEKTNKGVNRLMVRMRGLEGDVRVAVLLSPVWPDGGATGSVEVAPLAQWTR